MQHSPWHANRFRASQETRRFITAFTSARQLSLSWVSSIQSIPPASHFLKTHLNIILPSTQVVSFPQQPPPQPCIRLSSPHTSYMPHPSQSSRFYHPKNIVRKVLIIKLLIMWLSHLPCYLVPLRPKYSPQLLHTTKSIKPGAHYPHVTFYVLFSNPFLFLPARWLSYVDLCNLVTWCHVKRSVGAIFNKHFLHFWKQCLKSTRHVRHVSRNVCDNRNTRGVLAREPTRAPRQITWRNQSDRSVSVRQNSKLKYPECTRNITWAHRTWW
jgi:hypothetical protein